MTSMQRVLTALRFQEADRVPYFLLLTMHGAREMGLPIRDYFARPDLIAEAQLRMRARYGHDCLLAFSYASAEIEAFGGEVLFFEDGPPNSGLPFIQTPEQIARLAPPRIEDAPCLVRVLETIALLKTRSRGEVPVIAVVMSPFSLPVMQMGFEGYLRLLYDRPDLFARLMAVNEAFCVAWANAQLKAGATFVVYYDPVSSATITTLEQYRAFGLPIAKRTIARIDGPVATHFASGRCLPILDDLAQTGTAAVGVSIHEDMAALKTACAGRMSLVGNLNGIDMRRWSAAQAETAVKQALAQAGPGGGFILSDNHGEIPWQVPERVLDDIAAAVRCWGRYPLAWIQGGP
ncbi:MAG: methylcobamide--CoM methyltransferase MtbA [Methylococcaceae bacterium]|nr:MAG: methylcobamide--CoM methyltransferase MtbA [Methylococcaceae bacterium]